MGVITEYKRFENESDDELIYRITAEKDQIGSWQEVADILNELLGFDYTESKYRKQRQYFDKMFNANQSKYADSEAHLNEIKEQIRELEKAKVKLQTEKLEYSKWLREDARDEMIMDKICDAVRSLPPLEVPDSIMLTHRCEKQYVLAFGDEHFGTEFIIRGLKGEIINEYSPEIFEYRMWLLFSYVADIIRKEDIEVLNIFSLGDFTDGILRVSQLMKLRYGVVEGTVKYADFISTWMNELSKIVKISYYATDGNHSELRMLGEKKGTFKDDNMGKVVSEFIKARLDGNPNFEYIENPTGMIYANLAGSNIIGIHGDVKDIDNAIKDYSSIYGVEINYLLCGHLHHNRVKEVGFNQEVINVGSIIGVDDYSLSLRKTANASAKLLVFEGCGKGKVCEYTFKLN